MDPVYIRDHRSEIMVSCTPEVTLGLTRDVVERRETNKHASLVDHRQTAKRILAHQLLRARQIVLALARHDASGHHSVHLEFSERPALRRLDFALDFPALRARPLDDGRPRLMGGGMSVGSATTRLGALALAAAVEAVDLWDSLPDAAMRCSHRFRATPPLFPVDEAVPDAR